MFCRCIIISLVEKTNVPDTRTVIHQPLYVILQFYIRRKGYGKVLLNMFLEALGNTLEKPLKRHSA